MDCFLSKLSFWCSPRFKILGAIGKRGLVHFTETGVKVLPDTLLDSHGAYSGSAMQFGDNLFLFYTGNVRDENWIRHPLPDWSFDGQRWQDYKIDKILIDQPC